MAANVYVGEARLQALSNAAPDKANVLVGEAKLLFAAGATTAVANVLVGEAKLVFDEPGVTPDPATVFVGEARLEFGSRPVDRTGYWVYRGGVLAPVKTYVYNTQGVLV